jgi:hypothetical protein
MVYAHWIISIAGLIIAVLYLSPQERTYLILGFSLQVFGILWVARLAGVFQRALRWLQRFGMDLEHLQETSMSGKAEEKSNLEGHASIGTVEKRLVELEKRMASIEAERRSVQPDISAGLSVILIVIGLVFLTFAPEFAACRATPVSTPHPVTSVLP